MNADCAFWIGRTHPICQDYALASTRDDAAQVVLADGCSSSADTDIGARLLARAARQRLPDLPAVFEKAEEWTAYHAAAAHAAAGCARCLGLEPTCIDATLMTIQARNGEFQASCYGDGVVALGRHDGTAEVSVISFAASYPQYAGYLLEDARHQQWAAQPGNRKTVQRYLLTQTGVTAAETRPGQEGAELFAGTAADTRFVAVLSDGVHSFARTEQTETSRTTLSLSIADVLVDLLAFKSGQGRFVQRRVQAFRKECRKRGWHNADDAALGAVWLND